MGQNTIISIGVLPFMSAFITFAIMLILIAWYLSGRLGKIDGLIEGIIERLRGLETKDTGVASASSPIKLLEKGERILRESGLKQFIDDNKPKFLEHCKKSCNIKTAYDIQTAAFDYFDELKFEEDFEKKLKEIAFKEGLGMDIIRRIGGIYFRDVCLKDLNMGLEDLNEESS